MNTVRRLGIGMAVRRHPDTALSRSDRVPKLDHAAFLVRITRRLPMRFDSQLDQIVGKVNVWLLVIALGLGAFDLGAFAAMSFTRLLLVSAAVISDSPVAYRPKPSQSRAPY
jgi:hypothetical protein